MPVPFVIGAAAIVGIIAGGAQISRNHNESAENETSANSARDGAAKHWSGDRQIISSEWGRISEGFDGQYAPAKATQEAFKTWTHKQIWEALNGNDQDPGGVSQADVNAGADGWRNLKKGTETAIDDFRKEVDRAINDLWSGQAANAAMEGTRKYTDEAKKLPLSFQMVANGIDLMQGYLGQAKMAVEPPVEVSGFDEFMGHIPGNGVLKLNKHRANEAQALAQDVMIEVYQPGVIEVDGRTPILPTPHNPVTDPGEDPTTGPGTPGNPGNPGGPSTPGSPGNTPPTTEAPGENPNTQTPGQQPTTPSNTTQASTEPTVPSSTTTPQTYLEDPLGRPNTPGTPNTPGSPGSPGYPGSTPPAPGLPGRSIPGQPNQSGQPGQPAAARTTAPGPGRAGMAGMPGMMSPGARGGRGDDDDEHTTPDYLVQDRTTELLGVQPRVLPPGGVIGG